MVTYMGKFIPNLSSLSAPLRQLNHDNVQWSWNNAQEEAFANLKQCMTQAPLLKFFDVSKTTRLTVDASQAGLGAVLLQDGCPIAYASRSLTTTEQAYAQIEKEMLAVVYGCERFYQYVYGQHVTIETDHRPLVSMYNKPLDTAPARIQRFLLRMQKFDATLEYRPGKEMYLADTLSRAYLPNEETDTVYSEEAQQHIHLLMSNLPVSQRRQKEFVAATQEDSELQCLSKVVLYGWPDEKNEVPEKAKLYWPFREEITESDGLMFKGNKLIVPTSMHKEMLQVVHQGHLGIEKCKSRAREVLFWPGISSQIEVMVKSCATCAKYQKAQQREPLQPHPIPDRPWSTVGMDLFTSKTVNTS